MIPLLISGATCVMTLGGGLLALRLQTYRGLVLAFCAGALVAGARMDVIPDAMRLLESTHSHFHHHHIMFSCSLGFLFFYLFEHAAHQSTAHDHGPSVPNHAHQAGAWGAAGISVHSFFDGLAIGGAFQAGSEIGWIVALAVLLHKFADGVSTVGIMLGTDHSPQATTTMLSVTALAPIGGVMTQSAFPCLSHSLRSPLASSLEYSSISAQAACCRQRTNPTTRAGCRSRHSPESRLSTSRSSSRNNSFRGENRSAKERA